MYRCEECGNVIPEKTAQMKKVVETRKRQYYPKGKGYEIVKEIKVCFGCYEKV